MAAPVNPSTAKILAALKSRWSDLKLRLLRDGFAAAALPGLLASGKYDVADEARIAIAAYSLADALIARRGGKDT